MKIFYSDSFELPLPDKHRFPMSKYRLLRERIAASADFSNCQLLIPSGASDQQLGLVHDQNYIRKVVEGELTELEIRRIGFPYSDQLVERSRRSVGASICAAAAAVEDGVSVNLAGGTHHAFPDSGQGYCVFNDTAVAARTLQQTTAVERVLFVDCDVHQGNGTAAIAQNDPSLFTFSMHCDKNFPFRKSCSDLDVSLPAGVSDGEFLDALQKSLDWIAANFDAEFVFYLAGADPYDGDRLGKFSVSKPGLFQRDELVFDFCRTRGLPVAVAMAGGYAPNVSDVVDIHFATVNAARQNFRLLV